MIEKEFSDANNKVEELLQVIMSSPKTSSNPDDYINAHQDEYETILKMGDEALEYMLSLFEKGEGTGLKGHIMMSLCIDLLGDKNNVAAGSYTSPEEWYSKLSPMMPLNCLHLSINQRIKSNKWFTRRQPKT